MLHLSDTPRIADCSAADLDDESRIETAVRFVRVSTWIADDASLPQKVVRPAMHVSVDPQRGRVFQDEVIQPGGVARVGGMGLEPRVERPVTGRVVGDDDPRALRPPQAKRGLY